MKYLSPEEGAGSAPDNPKPSTLPLMSVWRVMMSTMPLSTRLQAGVRLLMVPRAAPACVTCARSKYSPLEQHSSWDRDTRHILTIQLQSLTAYLNSFSVFKFEL